ncbi:helix-turn-helix domain-containing protein [Rheinheimera baltica]|uniref:helix-turn-helix domain-containing protein n=1 Tax=Rheinheimera baltica TaxID=67576 RepID=UPI000419836D|nr:helix-turn-helix domain-containing protein [Rheinheimera baltica]
MEATAIKQALYDKGYSFAMIGEALDVNANVVSGVCYRRTTSKGVATAIAKVLEKPVTEVFPDVDSYRKGRLPKGNARTAKQAELQQLLAS